MKSNKEESNRVLLASLVTVNVKHTFSDEEKIQQSSLLAKTVKDCETEEANKKSDMAVYKNKIDRYKAEIKEISGKINNGYDFVDRAAELWLDYETNQRVYTSKETGDVIKTEPFHASDFQKKIDFDNEETARQEQIEENNAAHDYANAEPMETSFYNDDNGNLTDIPPRAPDALDKVIADKKAPNKKEKPKPSDNLPPQYGRGFETEGDDIL